MEEMPFHLAWLFKQRMRRAPLTDRRVENAEAISDDVDTIVTRRIEREIKL